MSRDFKKEGEWEKQKYKRLVAKVDIEVADKFLKKLGNKPYAIWLKEKINEFLEKN